MAISICDEQIFIPETECDDCEQFREELARKQDKLTAGDNITIDENNVISATGGDLSNYYTKTETDNLLDDKQDTLTAGSNIQIAQDGTISATDTTYTAGTGISIDANNVISTSAPTTKAELLALLGYEEVQLSMKDTNGNTVTKTILCETGA